MRFWGGGNEIAEVPEAKEMEKPFFDQESLNRYDKILGDDELEAEDSKMMENMKTGKGEELTSYQESLDAYDKILEDDKLKIEGQENISPEHVHTGLTEEEGIRVKEEQNWSAEIVLAIGSWEEYEIYKGAELEEQEIGDKQCLIRSDIDWNKKWETGKYDEDGNPIYETNEERIQKGRAPLDDNGNPIQLHHIGQHTDSPLAELTFEEHRCNGNDTILHDKTIETEAHAEGNNWDNERQDYWKDRFDYNEGGRDNV